jgi:hypothetical protein
MGSPLRTRAFTTRPLSSMIASMMTMPVSRALRAISV